MACWKPKDAQLGRDTERATALAFLSLSALQVLAGRKYGYDPQSVLTGTQGIYEKKYTSYPRSDCDFLPESQQTDAPAILANLRDIHEADLAAWSAKADPTIKSRAWNDKKITTAINMAVVFN